MPEIPESLLRRSAEAKAKALGLPVEQVLAEMKGEAPPPEPESPAAETEQPVPATPAEEQSAQAAQAEETEEPETGPEAIAAEAEEQPGVEEPAEEGAPVEPAEQRPPAASTEEEQQPVAVATAVEAPPEPVSGDGAGDGNGRRAAVIAPRSVAPAAGVPEGVRTQRLLTVVKARAIQQVKPEPTDKVNTWPHLMLAEFTALLAITGFLVILSVILQAPLLDPANFNATPNPSKAPWYFLGLQELLSYFDPQIAGVMVPTVVGLIGFILVPYVDRNPSTKPSDRKFAIMLYTFFLMGAATLTMIGVLFRGRGFNFSYPWTDGIFFDDIKDWVFFE